MKRFVVLVAYNARHTLRWTYGELPRDSYDDLLLIDDGSRDGTMELAAALGIPRVSHARNQGYGAAQKTGYRIALERGAGAVALLHADHQYDARRIPEMMALIERGTADAVIGSRRLGGRCLEGGMPRWKLAANVVLTGWINACLGVRLTDPHSGLRVYSRRFLQAVPVETYRDDFLFDAQMIYGGIRQGLRLDEVPVPTRYFPEASQISFWAGLGYGMGCLRLGAAELLRRVECRTGRRGRSSDIDARLAKLAVEK